MIAKYYNGKTYDAGPHPLSGAPQIGHFYEWKELPFCLRCGKRNK